MLHSAPARAEPVGGIELVYRYTVTGSDKLSIDTGVDTPQAGSNDWTNCDLLEVIALLRSDDAGAVANFVAVVNNDASALYDLEVLYGNNATPGATPVLAANNWNISGLHGAGGSASYAACVRMGIPFPTQTDFWKTGELSAAIIDATAASNWEVEYKIGYRSLAAITRLSFAPATALKKFKVGSRIAIYKRIAS